MRRVFTLLLIVLGWTASINATSALTTVTGTVVGPGGSNPSGTLTLSWQRTQNDANPRQVIAAGRQTYIITSGVIPSIQLFPNSAMLPAGTCYSAQWVLNGANSQRYWTVPVSATPVDVGLVEGSIPCSSQPGPTVAPGQISSAGATPGQVLSWNGSYWAPAAGGGGGGGNPGGTNGQVQFNSLGAFGGFTVAGDCSLGIPNFICTKTNGVPFAPSATTDTTNAANISSGVLPPARGGTGAGAFAPGSVPFIGTAGVYQQSNSNLSYDLVNSRFTISSTGAANPSSIRLDNANGGNQTLVSFADAGTEKYQIGKQPNNSFFIYDAANTRDALRVTTGVVQVNPVGGNVVVGGTNDAGYRLDIQSGNSTLRVFNQVAGGSTVLTLQAGISQSALPILQMLGNSGTALSQIGPDGCFNELNGSITRSVVVCQNLIGLTTPTVISWRNGVNWDAGAADSGLSRISAGLLGVGNGTLSDFSGSLKMANLTLTGAGFTGGGVVAICADNSGNLTTSGCPGGGGGGTVTHTSGPLTAGRLVLGNGSNDITVLGSSGTTTTLYHGNAGGAGSFSAVSLTADVSGILPFANGGTGTNTNFTNHFFFGNSTGGAAAPVAVQPTFADLAAGTVGAMATFPGGDLFCGGVNAQSGTSYTIATTDECKLTTFNNGSATAVTLPQATTTGFGAGAYFLTYNRGAGTVTITPTTSTINGASTAVLVQGQGAWIHSDGANYSAWISAAPSGSGTVTSITFSSPLSGGTITASGTVGCATCVTSAAALTSNQLVIGGGLQASAALGSLGTTTTLLHGNAGGAPSFSAVSLTADVTGVLPTANIAVALANQTSINGLGITASTGTLTIANAKTLTSSNTLTLAGTDSSSIAFGTGGTVAYRANNLSVFASTTSAQLFGVLSDPTGTSLAVFNTNPLLVTPKSTDIRDANGNVFVLSSATASAVDSVTVTNAAAANPATVKIGGTGTDSNINLELDAKGTGVVRLGSANATVDSSGNGVFVGLTVGTGSGVAGHSAYGQGTSFTAPTSSVGWQAPTSVTTKFMMTLPAAPTTGFLLNTGTSDPSVISFVASNGTGNVLLSAGTIAVASGKTFTVSNTMTQTATDSSTVAFGGGGTVAYVIASGTSALGTSSIAPGACATVVTTSATGVASTDAIIITPNASIKAVNGYTPLTTGGLSIVPYPTANNVNIDVCNWGSLSVNPGAVTLNWRVIR